MPKKRGGWTVHEDTVSHGDILEAISQKHKHSSKPPPIPFPLPRAVIGTRDYTPLDGPVPPTVLFHDAPKICVKKNCKVVLTGPDARFKYCPACRAEQREWSRRKKERKDRMKQLGQELVRPSSPSSNDGLAAPPPVAQPSKEELWARMSSHERLAEWMMQLRASGTLQEGTDIVLGKRKVGSAPDGSVAAKRTKADNVYPEYLSAGELVRAMRRCIVNSAPRLTSFRGCFCVVQSTDEHVTRSRILEEAGDTWAMVFDSSRSVSWFQGRFVLNCAQASRNAVCELVQGKRAQRAEGRLSLRMLSRRELRWNPHVQNTEGLRRRVSGREGYRQDDPQLERAQCKCIIWTLTYYVPDFT